jgi:Ser/Thr protein kinase RdoA (MazF antagonist)
MLRARVRLRASLGRVRVRDLAASLERDYGIVARSIERHAGGFEASAFVVDGSWFVKVWRRDPPANLAVLDELAQRGLPVVPPVHTFDGRLAASTYAVYPFVRGRPAPEDPSLVGRTLRRVHAITDVELSRTTLDEWCVDFLRDHIEHPWIVDRQEVLAAAVDRLESVIDRAQRTVVPYVLVHHDLYGNNLIVDDDGHVVAILDWDHASLAPREHDLWMLIDEKRSDGLLAAYGARDLNVRHLEYALLARALRDLAARVHDEVDRPGIEQWGYRRLARLDTVLDQVR